MAIRPPVGWTEAVSTVGAYLREQRGSPTGRLLGLGCLPGCWFALIKRALAEGRSSWPRWVVVATAAASKAEM